MLTRHFAAGLAALSLLTACQMSGQTIGTIGGAAAGAGLGKAIGGGTVAIIVGAAAGAWLGGELGKNLDDRDRNAMRSTAQYALSDSPAGSTSSWQNPDSGHSGTITPQETFMNAQGQECREFQQTVNVDGRTETGYATACRQVDGSWKVVG